MPKTTQTIKADTEVSGAEFRDFYRNHWPEGWYVEEMPYEAEDETGNWIFPDDARARLDWFGVAFYQGKDDKHPRGVGRPMHELYAEVMGSRPKQLTVAFKVDPDKADAVVAAATAAGATLI